MENLRRYSLEEFVGNPERSEKWLRMIGFRNILVHEYLAIDREIVHQVLAHDLPDLGDLRTAFAKFL